MSSELKASLDKAIQEECREAATTLEAEFPRVKSLLMQVANAKKFDFLLSVEGSKPSEQNRDEKDLALLEKAGFVKGETKYTHRNVYRQYVLTQKGAEVAEKLAAKP